MDKDPTIPQQIPTPDEVWVELETAVSASLSELAAQYKVSPETAELEEIKNAERIFVTRIWAAITQIKERDLNAQILVLFDVDDTLCAEAQTIRQDIVRPSAPLLLQKINALGCTIGLITDRPALGMQRLMDSAQAQGHPIAQFFEEKNRFSSRAESSDVKYPSGTLGSPDDYEENQRKMLAANFPVVTSLARLQEQKFSNIRRDGAQKCRIISRIRETSPDLTIVAVDDAPYPEMLDPDKKCYGVYLNRQNNNGTFNRFSLAKIIGSKNVFN